MVSQMALLLTNPLISIVFHETNIENVFETFEYFVKNVH